MWKTKIDTPSVKCELNLSGTKVALTLMNYNRSIAQMYSKMSPSPIPHPLHIRPKPTRESNCAPSRSILPLWFRYSQCNRRISPSPAPFSISILKQHCRVLGNNKCFFSSATLQCYHTRLLNANWWEMASVLFPLKCQVYGWIRAQPKFYPYLVGPSSGILSFSSTRGFGRSTWMSEETRNNDSFYSGGAVAEMPDSDLDRYLSNSFQCDYLWPKLSLSTNLRSSL